MKQAEMPASFFFSRAGRIEFCCLGDEAETQRCPALWTGGLPLITVRLRLASPPKQRGQVHLSWQSAALATVCFA